MLYGLYMSAGGMALHQHRQDVIANNLANVDTVGFKRQLAVFQERRIESGSRFWPEQHRNMTGGGFVSQVHTDWSVGPIDGTSRSLDVALDGPGMLTVRDGQGVAYTRDGRLAAVDGTLVRAVDGRAVLDGEGKTIEVGSAGAESLRIDSAGRVHRGGQVVGELGIVEFEDLNALRRLGENLFGSSQRPLSATGTRVVGGSLESSGVNPANELVEMIKAARQFQMNAEMISMQDQSLARLVNELPKL